MRLSNSLLSVAEAMVINKYKLFKNSIPFKIIIKLLSKWNIIKEFFHAFTFLSKVEYYHTIILSILIWPKIGILLTIILCIWFDLFFCSVIQNSIIFFFFFYILYIIFLSFSFSTCKFWFL